MYQILQNVNRTGHMSGLNNKENCGFNLQIHKQGRFCLVVYLALLSDVCNGVKTDQKSGDQI